jgi:hypothetical protein
MDLEKFTIQQATHNLRCRHQIGYYGFNYAMPCIFISRTKRGKAKVVVFGKRAWANNDHIKHLRYVNPYRLTSLKQ